MQIKIGNIHGRNHIPRKEQPCKAPCLLECFGHWAWKDRRCFILGGGPSLKGFDYSQLNDEYTIGINKTFTTYHPTINYSMDYPLYEKLAYVTKSEESLKLHKAWEEYNGIKVFFRESRAHLFDQNVYYVQKLANKSVSFDLSAGIYPGSNSGFGALMIAVALGCKKIGLLGYDLCVKDGDTHWHNGYAGQSKKNVPGKLETFIPCFEEYAPSLLAYGIDVVNLNPESALKCFRFSTLEEFVNE